MTLKAYALIFAFMAVNLAIFTANCLSTAGVLPSFGQEPIVDPNNFLNMFNLNVFTVLTGVVGGAVIGVLAMLTRSYALSGGVLILWIVGIVFKPIQDIFIGLPLLVKALLPSSIWFLSEIIVAFCALTLFVFIVEIIAGREILG